MKYQFKENDYVYTGDVNITNELIKLVKDNGYATFITDEWSTDSKYVALSYINNEFMRFNQNETYVFNCLLTYRTISIDDFKALITGKLPKYWIVDCKEKGCKEVVDYINSKYTQDWRSDTKLFRYIGVDGTKGFNNTNKWNNISEFINNPFLLPVQYVLDAIKEESKPKYEFKVGDKVKLPKTKSIGEYYSASTVINNAKYRKQDFLYIKKILGDEYTLNVKMDVYTNGDYFALSDLELYEERIIKKSNITYPATYSECYIKYPIGARIKIIKGGAGSCFIEPNAIGTIVHRNDVDFNKYGGEYITINNECYIKLDIPVGTLEYIGICKNNGHKLEILNTKTNMYTITREQLKEVHDIVCATWQNKLIDKAKTFPLSNTIKFTDEEVKEMFITATPVQLPLIKKLFPNYNNVVIYDGFDCINVISSDREIGYIGNGLNVVVYVKRDNAVVGSIVNEDKGYILRLAGGSGASGYHATIEDCIKKSISFNYKFFIL